jgi:hypothetical protein
MSGEGRAPAVEVRNDDTGALDEIVASHPRFIHIERMDGHHWFLGITDRDGADWRFGFGAKKGRSLVEFTRQEGPYPPKEQGRDIRDALAEALFRAAVGPHPNEWERVRGKRKWRTAAGQVLAALPSVKLMMVWEE